MLLLPPNMCMFSMKLESDLQAILGNHHVGQDCNTCLQPETPNLKTESHQSSTAPAGMLSDAIPLSIINAEPGTLVTLKQQHKLAHESPRNSFDCS